MTDQPACLTDGPWTIGDGGPNGWPIEAKQGPLEVCVGRIYGLDDARLIAKARHLPQIIEALEQTTAFLADRMASPEEHAIWKQADAALALVQETE